MKIAITGGAGFIGAHLTKAYLDAGHEVIVIDSLTTDSSHVMDTRARLYQIDIRDEQLRHILLMERPDIVSYHTAHRDYVLPTSETLTDADVHIRGLLNVLESCVSASVGKIIFASGGNGLYGEVSPALLPITEEQVLSPQRPYDISKAAGEWYIRYYSQQYGLAHTILRYAYVYGEQGCSMAYHPLTSFVEALLEGRRPLIGHPADEVRDYIFIDDVVQANLCVLTRGKNTTLHISSARGQTLDTFCQTAAHIMQCAYEPTYLSQARSASTPIILDNTKARRILEWQPTIELAEGVRRVIAAMREQPRQQNVESSFR